MPRTRNITREQWHAAVSPTADPTAAVIRSLGSSQDQADHSYSSFMHDKTRRSSVSAVSSFKENYRNENDQDENAHPADTRSKGRKRKQRPLQDITDIVVVDSNRPSEVEDNPKSKKRAKRANREILSPVKEQLTHKAHFPSSLPPSSPPPLFDERLPISNVKPDQKEPFDEEEVPLASDDAEPSHNSDPFGFFAVERDLKAQRNLRPGLSLNESSQPGDAGGLILAPDSFVLNFTLDITEAPRALEEEEDMISPYATPPTPHKKKRRWNMGGEDKLLLSPRTGSLPSSPSPLKVRDLIRVRDYAQDRSGFVSSTPGPSVIREERDEDEETQKGLGTTTHRVLRSRAKGKGVEKVERLPEKKLRTKGKKRRESRTPSDPMEFAQRLVDRLPKRRRKRVRTEELTEPESEERRTRRKRTRKVKIKSEDRAAEPQDQRRKAVLEYFKKLEEYTMSEEKVYVI